MKQHTGSFSPVKYGVVEPGGRLLGDKHKRRRAALVKEVD
jgi:hypothetical protein